MHTDLDTLQQMEDHIHDLETIRNRMYIDLSKDLRRDLRAEISQITFGELRALERHARAVFLEKRKRIASSGEWNELPKAFLTSLATYREMSSVTFVVCLIWLKLPASRAKLVHVRALLASLREERTACPPSTESS